MNRRYRVFRERPGAWVVERIGGSYESAAYRTQGEAFGLAERLSRILTGFTRPGS